LELLEELFVLLRQPSPLIKAIACCCFIMFPCLPRDTIFLNLLSLPKLFLASCRWFSRTEVSLRGSVMDTTFVFGSSLAHRELL